MYQFILCIHTLLSCLLLVLVLIQQGKGAIAGTGFGQGASQTVFGSRGAGSFLFRVTLGLMVLFFCTSLILNRLLTQAVLHQRAILPITEAVVAQTKPLPSRATPGTSIRSDSIPIGGNNVRQERSQQSKTSHQHRSAR